MMPMGTKIFFMTAPFFSAKMFYQAAHDLHLQYSPVCPRGQDASGPDKPDKVPGEVFPGKDDLEASQRCAHAKKIQDFPPLFIFPGIVDFRDGYGAAAPDERLREDLSFVDPAHGRDRCSRNDGYVVRERPVPARLVVEHEIVIPHVCVGINNEKGGNFS